MPQATPKLTSVAPVFLVSDVVASATYYRDRLGFTYDRFWNDPPTFVMVQRDDFTIMLAQHSHGDGPADTNPNGGVTGHDDQWDASIWVQNLEALYDEVKAAGATISVELRDQPYGMREFQVADPDGYQIVFGEPR